MTVTALARTLDQELVALARGASLACPVCSEFVLHVRGAHGLAIACPECKSILAEEDAAARAHAPGGSSNRISPAAPDWLALVPPPGVTRAAPAPGTALPSLTQAG